MTREHGSLTRRHGQDSKRQPKEHESSKKCISFKELEIELAFYTAGQEDAGGPAAQDARIQIHPVKFMGNHHHIQQVFFWVISTAACYTWLSASTCELTNSQQVKKLKEATVQTSSASLGLLYSGKKKKKRQKEDSIIDL